MAGLGIRRLVVVEPLTRHWLLHLFARRVTFCCLSRPSRRPDASASVLNFATIYSPRHSRTGLAYVPVRASLFTGRAPRRGDRFDAGRFTRAGSVQFSELEPSLVLMGGGLSCVHTPDISTLVRASG